MSLALWTLSLALAAPPQSASPAAFVPPDDQALQKVVAEGKRKPIEERVVEVTDVLVGAPYVLNPLGEGAGPDADPRLRLDAFDCTTFVETGLAMSLVEEPHELEAVLDLIRYRAGRPDFQNRRHFPEAEWIPDLVGLGLLEDVTRAVAGDDVVVAKKTLDREVWSRRGKPILKDLDPERVPAGEFTLDVWPIEKAKEGFRKIPPGTVLSVVRADRARVPVRVSHQGLVVEKDGKLYLRHAANRIYHRVVDEPLHWFLTRNAKYKKWPVTGVHLARIQEPDELWRQRARAATN